MFLGHFAAALVAARPGEGARRLPLGTSLLAAQLPDAIWPCLVLAGVERVTIVPGDTAFTPLRFDHYPWSHSLVAVVLWACAFAGIVFWRRRAALPAVLAALLVTSHWVLDAASHRPDMPVLPGGPFVGLGLWNSVPATLIVEGLMFAAAVSVYARGWRPGTGFWALVGVLTVIYLANAFGPPPPSVTAIGLSGLVAVPLLWWWGNKVGRE